MDPKRELSKTDLKKEFRIMRAHGLKNMEEEGGLLFRTEIPEKFDDDYLFSIVRFMLGTRADIDFCAQGEEETRAKVGRAVDGLASMAAIAKERREAIIEKALWRRAVFDQEVEQILGLFIVRGCLLPSENTNYRDFWDA